ncbi:MAG: hypothetical protein IPN20_23325 [Haliscomenobacter sp.]|nr:hypothetical protein [Haliscomenobacter sp.]
MAHYRAAALPCRVYTPQHKGKVESGVKYVKNNFLRGLKHRNWERLAPELRTWTDTVANHRTHGTTKRVPFEVWQRMEHDALLALPELRYQFYHVEERKVTRFGHVTFRNNYYSVPHTLVGQTLRLFTDGALLRISHQGTGGRPAPHTRWQGAVCYAERTPAAAQTSAQPRVLRPAPQRSDRSASPPTHGVDAAKPSGALEGKGAGLLHLCRVHPAAPPEACQRALDHGLSSYRAVRDICTMLEHTPPAGRASMPRLAPAAWRMS